MNKIMYVIFETTLKRSSMEKMYTHNCVRFVSLVYVMQGQQSNVKIVDKKPKTKCFVVHSVDDCCTFQLLNIILCIKIYYRF